VSLKIQPASREEHAFAERVNGLLADTGARVTAFSLLNTETEVRGYGLTFSCGTKRTTINADSPFHYDPPQDVVKRVREWLAKGAHADRWSTAVKYAE
jgi:hypothetical protein